MEIKLENIQPRWPRHDAATVFYGVGNGVTLMRKHSNYR